MVSGVREGSWTVPSDKGDYYCNQILTGTLPPPFASKHSFFWLKHLSGGGPPCQKWASLEAEAPWATSGQKLVELVCESSLSCLGDWESICWHSLCQPPSVSRSHEQRLFCWVSTDIFIWFVSTAELSLSTNTISNYNFSFLIGMLRGVQMVFQSSCTILHYHRQCVSDSFSISSLAFGVITFFGHSNRCGVISQYGFNLYFPNC